MRRIWLRILTLALVVTCLPAISAELDYVAEARRTLEQQLGKAPTSEQISDALNEEIVDLYQKSKYRQALGIAQQTVPFVDAELGPEHPETLTSVNNLV